MLLALSRLSTLLLLAGISLLPSTPLYAQTAEDRAVQEPEALAAEGLPPVPDALRQAVMSGDTRTALKLLDGLAKRDAEVADAWLYTRARVLAEDGQFSEAMETLEQVERDFPKGAWRFKARFLLADLMRETGRMAEAEAIYEQEAGRLLSSERQSELAEIYLRFARLLSTDPDPQVPGNTQPDYQRARALYQKAIELEIPAKQREEALWGIAHCGARTDDWNAARQAYRAYLAEFGEALEVAGTRVLEARYRSAEAEQELGEVIQARYVFEDLIDLFDQAHAVDPAGFAKSLSAYLRAAGVEKRVALADLEGRARYQVAQTHGGSAQGLALSIAALERMIAAMPKHAWVGRARAGIAEAYRASNQLDKAVLAYDVLLAWQDPAELSQETREVNARLRQTALFQKGAMFLALERPSEAIPVFQDYVGRYPTGAEWAQAQQSLIDAEYRIGVLLRSEQEWQGARDAWQSFLAAHPLDPRARQIAFDLGQMYLEQARSEAFEGVAKDEARSGLWRAAIDSWQRLARKYPSTNEASAALFSVGGLYESELQELDAAIRAYRTCSFGSFAGQAMARLDEMTERSLGVETPRVWRSNETAKIAVQLRNSEEITVRLYPLDLQAYFRKHLTHQRIEDLDLDLIAPERVLTIEVKDYEEYKPIRQDVELPLEGAGVWAVAVDDGERRATTLVVRSDLDMIVKSSRREFFVYVQDMVRDRPAAGVDVLLALPDPNGGAPSLYTVTTGRDGVASKELDDLVTRPELRVLAQNDGHYASDGLSVGALSLSQGLQPRGYIYPDRSAYRPGQRVNWRGVLREVKDGRFEFEAGAEYLAEVLDSQGRIVRERRLTLSEFGTVHDELVLPHHAPLGRWTVRLSRPSGASFQGGFDVREFELQTVALDFEFDQSVYYRGETVHGIAEARYYYGEPVVDQPLQLQLPDGREMLSRTDAEGRVRFEIATRDFTGSRFLRVSAHLPEEGVHATGGVPVSAMGYSSSVRVDQSVVLTGTSFSAHIATSDAAGLPVARDLSLEVLHRKPNKRGGWTDVTVNTIAVKTNERGQASAGLTLAEGGNYVLRVRGTDRFGNPVLSETTVFASGEADAQRLRILAASHVLPVGADLSVQLVNRTEAKRALLTFEGERVLGYRILELEPGANELSLPLAVELAPNFRLAVAVMDGNRFHTAAADFEVERRLQVKVEPRQRELAPGEEAVVDLTVVDELGKPVRGEFSLAVVDESIFAQFAAQQGAIDAYFAQDAWRSVGFQTTSSCEFRYQGQTREIAEVLLAEARRELALETWERDRADLRSELQSQQAFSGPGDAVTARVKLGRGLQPSAGAYFDAFDRDGVVSEELEQLGYALGIGGGSGGKFGGRRGAGGASKRGFLGGEDFGGFGEDAAAAGELAKWVDAGLAFWTPSVVTDKQGKAELRFRMPEASTEWRLTARGVGELDHFGEGTARLISRAPFFVELRTPRSLTEGDRPALVARVHNLTEHDGTAQLQLRVLKDGVVESFPAEVEVLAGGQAEVSILMDSGVPLVSELEITAVATAQFGGEDFKSTANKVIPVRAWGMEVADYASGVLSSEAVFDLQLPAGVDYRDRVLELSFGSNLSDLVIDAAMDRNALTEVRSHRVSPIHAATASRLIGACGALAMLEELGGSHPQGTSLRDRAEALSVALVSAQSGDGGWTWSGAPGRASEPETSARVMHALAAARERGIPVAAQALDRGVGYLLQVFQDTSQRENERKAIVLHALSLHDRGDFGTANRLHRSRNGLSPAALAYTALALLEMERKPMAVEIAELLASKVALDTGASTASNMAFHRSRLEMTALAAIVLQKATPAAAATRAAMDYLLNHRPWNDARGRGLAASAVGAWIGATQPDAGEVSIVVEINGESMEMELGKGQFSGFSQSDLDIDKLSVRLQLKGRSRPYFQAVLRAFTRDMTERPHKEFLVTRHLYEAEQPLYDGRRIQTGFSVIERAREGWNNVVNELERGGTTRVSLQMYYPTGQLREGDDSPYLVMHVPLPAGTSVLPGSVEGRYERYILRDHEIVVYLGQHKGTGWINYKLIGAVPGKYRTLPVRVEDLSDPSRFALGKPHDLEILPRGRASTDDYKETPDELYYLGLAALERADEEMAFSLLSRLYDGFGSELRDEMLATAAGKLLFLAIERGTPNEVVRYFEVLKEKNPGLNIPFEKVLSVGRAYRSLEEYERALLIFRATIEESFGKDLKVAGTLDAQGEPSGSIAVLERLWLEFPDLPIVVETYLTLSDKLLTLAPHAHEVPGLVASGLGRGELTKAGIDLLQRFLTLYHADPLAPEAGLNLVAAYLDLEDFETGVTLAQEMSGRFEKPRFQDAFRYSKAVAQWYMGKDDDAVRTLRGIADAKYKTSNGAMVQSENRDLALYILAQIHHARRKFSEAAEYYEQVATVFPDARDVLDGFQAKQIALDEVTEVRPGKTAEVELRYRNIEEAELLVYRVDLMTLYLRERNLSEVTAVNLAGIAPTQRKQVSLKSSTGMREAEQTVRLKLDEPGAYLVICRGDELHTSGLVLVSDIELEVAEDLGGGRLRVQALDRKGEGFVRDVDVRVVGSNGGDFVTGRTDPRGLFVAEGVYGTATVIARRGDQHYAFFRGTPIGPPAPASPPSLGGSSGEAPAQQLEAGDYLGNVFRFNAENQDSRAQRFDKEVQRERKGVSVGQTRGK
jgi:alpha-2-macroglobulin